MALLSANCVVCERALQEVDKVLSAIRIVDIFYTAVVPDVPIDQQVVAMTVLGFLRFTADDDDNHTVELTIVRPNGDATAVPIVSNYSIPKGSVENSPKALYVHGQIGVSPKQFGLHHVVVMLDGREVTRNQFTLEERSPTPVLPNSVEKESDVQPRKQ
jgi:hypothetical protein